LMFKIRTAGVVERGKGAAHMVRDTKEKEERKQAKNKEYRGIAGTSWGGITQKRTSHKILWRDEKSVPPQTRQIHLRYKIYDRQGDIGGKRKKREGTKDKTIRKVQIYKGGGLWGGP